MDRDYASKLMAPGGDARGGYIGIDPNQPQEAYSTAPKEAPLERLSRALNLLEQATDLTRSTTDLLCGPQPETKGPGSVGEPIDPSGLFKQITLSAQRVERMATVISDCMQRIHRVGG